MRHRAILISVALAACSAAAPAEAPPAGTRQHTIGDDALIADEPTSALNEDDVDNLLELMRTLKQQGVTLIMISHKLREIMRIAEAVCVGFAGSEE